MHPTNWELMLHKKLKASMHRSHYETEYIMQNSCEILYDVQNEFIKC